MDNNRKDLFCNYEIVQVTIIKIFKEIEATSGKDNRDKWIYDDLGNFHYMKNTSLCLTSMEPV